MRTWPTRRSISPSLSPARWSSRILAVSVRGSTICRHSSAVGRIAYCMLSRVERPEPLVRNASDVATELLRNAIVDGTLEPGQRLKEEELARSLGISRTPVREALVMLQAEGLIDAAPNRSAMVRTHSAEELDDLYQLRALLEAHAARRAAGRAGNELVSDLWASC